MPILIPAIPPNSPIPMSFCTTYNAPGPSRALSRRIPAYPPVASSQQDPLLVKGEESNPNLSAHGLLCVPHHSWSMLIGQAQMVRAIPSRFGFRGHVQWVASKEV